ncbi:POTRA domain-containing protein [Terrimonas rubra]|uniref:POTRA domain-containing protein n=1 Tax=Terrimonas rubra TaxID=1035890 RepID=A0ABW6A1D2_9BACT
MLKEKKYIVWLAIFILICSCSFGQHVTATPADTGSAHSIAPTYDSLFTVRNIVLVGNKRTRNNVILRELPFKSGDHLPLNSLVGGFEKARTQLMNTTLFHDVTVALKSFEGYQIDVLVQVKERWYIFPFPYFKPVDRNLNQWLVEEKASLSRVNYGIKLMHNNTTGYNDKLRFWLITGYTRQLSYNYDRLYIDKKMKWGMRVGMELGSNREINYGTEDDKQVFYKDASKYVRNFHGGSVELTYRPAIYTRHRFGFSYKQESVLDTVLKLNPNYFPGGRTKIAYPEIYYGMSYYNMDYIPYPTTGYGLEFTVAKRGYTKAMNVWHASVKGIASWPLDKKTFVNLNVIGSISAPFRQSFYNKRLFGYGDFFMQGYEYNVIDGVAGGIVRASINRKLFAFNIRFPSIKTLIPKQIPITFYGKSFVNMGYVYNPQSSPLNRLDNRVLMTGGFGIDVLTLYDFVLKLEYSFNQIGQNGLYLHKKSPY